MDEGTVALITDIVLTGDADGVGVIADRLEELDHTTMASRLRAYCRAREVATQVLRYHWSPPAIRPVHSISVTTELTQHHQQSVQALRSIDTLRPSAMDQARRHKIQQVYNLGVLAATDPLFRCWLKLSSWSRIVVLNRVVQLCTTGPLDLPRVRDFIANDPQAHHDIAHDTIVVLGWLSGQASVTYCRSWFGDVMGMLVEAAPTPTVALLRRDVSCEVLLASLNALEVHYPGQLVTTPQHHRQRW